MPGLVAPLSAGLPLLPPLSCAVASASGSFLSNLASRNSRISFHVFGSLIVLMKLGDRPTGVFLSLESGFMSSTESRSMGMLIEGPRERPPLPVAGVPGALRGVDAPDPAGLRGEAGRKGGDPAGSAAELPSSGTAGFRLSSMGEVPEALPARLSKLVKSVVSVIDGTRAWRPPLLLALPAESEAVDEVRLRRASLLMDEMEEDDVCLEGESGPEDMDCDLKPKGEGAVFASPAAAGRGDGMGEMAAVGVLDAAAAASVAAALGAVAVAGAGAGEGAAAGAAPALMLKWTVSPSLTPSYSLRSRSSCIAFPLNNQRWALGSGAPLSFDVA